MFDTIIALKIQYSGFQHAIRRSIKKMCVSSIITFFTAFNHYYIVNLSILLMNLLFAVLFLISIFY